LLVGLIGLLGLGDQIFLADALSGLGRRYLHWYAGHFHHRCDLPQSFLHIDFWILGLAGS
jgi:hypothetical protein